MSDSIFWALMSNNLFLFVIIMLLHQIKDAVEDKDNNTKEKIMAYLKRKHKHE